VLMATHVVVLMGAHVVVPFVPVVLVIAFVAAVGGMGLVDQRRGQQLHAAARTVRGLLAGHLRVHRARVRRRGGQQLHAALRAATGLVLDHVRVHRAGVDDRALGRLEVHLGDERERLVRLGGEVGGESLALGGKLRIAPHRLKAVGQ
jgi:hypothetical protein